MNEAPAATAHTVFDFEPHQNGHRLTLTRPAREAAALASVWAKTDTLELAVRHDSLMVAAIAFRPTGGAWDATTWSWWSGDQWPPLGITDARLFPETLLTLAATDETGAVRFERRFRLERQLSWQINRSAQAMSGANYKTAWLDMLVSGFARYSPEEIARSATYKGSGFAVSDG
jgi:hypothetical protein